jgi:PTS system mannose-specific IIB component
VAIVVARIDDRLVHGQVTTNWVRSNDIQVIVVVDDKLATDEIQISVLKMAAPSNIKLYVLPVDKFTEKYKAGILDKYRIMLIFNNPFAPLKLIESGIKINSVNIGGMRFKEGRRQLTKSVSVTEREAEAIRSIISHGVEVEHRQLQTDTKVYLKDIL